MRPTDARTVLRTVVPLPVRRALQGSDLVAQCAAQRYFERRLGVATGGNAYLDDAGLDDGDRAFFEECHWLPLHRALRTLDPRATDVFADLGCGKGQALLVAARQGFGRVLGVELEPGLARAAAANVEAARPRLRCPDVRVLTSDVLTWPVDDDLSVVFLYCPFMGEVFRGALDRVFASYDRRARPLRILYAYPWEHDWLIGTGRVVVEDVRPAQWPAKPWWWRSGFALVTYRVVGPGEGGAGAPRLRRRLFRPGRAVERLEPGQPARLQARPPRPRDGVLPAVAADVIGRTGRAGPQLKEGRSTVRNAAPCLEPADAASGGRDGRTPFAVRHRLQQHPLLTLDAIAELALELQAAARRAGRLTDDKPVEHHRGDLPPVLPGGRPPRREDLDVAEMIRTVETNGCWVVLWNIEEVPRYAELLDECVAQARGLATPGRRQVFREGFIFISAPDTVTPLHIDPEHNVLLQVTGEKTTTVGTLSDTRLWHREIERVLLGGDRHLPVAADAEQEFRLTPGHGVYVPPFAPHWVRNGPTPCISLSVTWRTEQAYRTELVHTVNGRLRRLGMHPVPPGSSRSRDAAKIAAFSTARRAMSVGRMLAQLPRAR